MFAVEDDELEDGVEPLSIRPLSSERQTSYFAGAQELDAFLEHLGDSPWCEVFAVIRDGFRVYDSSKAVRELGWRPSYTFKEVVEKLSRGEEWRSELTIKVGKREYHAVSTGVYTVR